MKNITYIEQIELGKEMDQLEIARVKIPNKLTLKQFKKYEDIVIISFGLPLLVFWIILIITGIEIFGILSVIFLVIMFSLQINKILYYKQVGTFEVKKPHQFKETEEVDITTNKIGKLIKRTNIIDVKPAGARIDKDKVTEKSKTSPVNVGENDGNWAWFSCDDPKTCEHCWHRFKSSGKDEIITADKCCSCGTEKNIKKVKK